MSAFGPKRTLLIAPHTSAFEGKADMSGKPAGIHGGEVARYCLEGKIKEVADYCETDIVNTYRVWLRYELFRGRLTKAAFAASEADLFEFINLRSNAKPHLIDLMR